MPGWDELFTKEIFRWKNIHDGVIELADWLDQKHNVQILDLGCGAGRHSVYLEKRGYHVVGMDLSWNGLGFTQDQLNNEQLPSDLVMADMISLPYRNNFFDAVVSIHVIFHNPLSKIRQTIAEILRVLRPGGVAVITFQSKRSYRYGRGIMIEPDTFLPDVGSDSGIAHHFSSLQELADELEGFIVRKVQLAEDLKEDGRRSSHWEVFIEKPGTI